MLMLMWRSWSSWTTSLTCPASTWCGASWQVEGSHSRWVILKLISRIILITTIITIVIKGSRTTTQHYKRWSASSTVSPWTQLLVLWLVAQHISWCTIFFSISANFDQRGSIGSVWISSIQDGSWNFCTVYTRLSLYSLGTIQVGVAYLKWVPPFRGIYKRIFKNMNMFRGRMEALVREAKGSFSDGEVVSLKMTMTMSDFLIFRCEATSTCS